MNGEGVGQRWLLVVKANGGAGEGEKKGKGIEEEGDLCLNGKREKEKGWGCVAV